LGGAESANAGNLVHHLWQLAQELVVALAAEERNTGGDDSGAEFAARRDAQAAVVEPGALAFLGGEHLVTNGVEDEAGDEVALALQTDRNRKMRNAVNEVRGAVDRIDEPAVRLVEAFDHAAFFHDEAIVRTGARQFIAQRSFDAQVGLRDEVGRTLLRCLQMFDLAEIADQHLGRLAGGCGHHVHQRGVDRHLIRRGGRKWGRRS